MSLGDVMAAEQLGAFAEVGLLLFVAAFVAVGLGTFRRKNREVYERARFLPLEEDAAPPGDTESRWRRPTPQRRQRGVRERR